MIVPSSLVQENNIPIKNHKQQAAQAVKQANHYSKSS